MGYTNGYIILLLMCILVQHDGIHGSNTGKYQIKRQVFVVHDIIFCKAINIHSKPLKAIQQLCILYNV